MKRERRKLTPRELKSITTPGLVCRVVRPDWHDIESMYYRGEGVR